jgi:steroid 5-alpha reductase family enzyme
MGNVAAIAGVVLLLLGIVLVALRGGRRSSSWAPYIGVALAVLGLGVEVVGAVVAA